MELNFVQSSEVFGKNTLAWETEFTVDKEFNLHLERVKGGEIMMMQRTSGTFFDVVEDFHMDKGDIIYDYDSAPFLGTKTIKIVSVSAIRFAAVTTDGEITEIKSQSKEVEVTANGTMDITPDAGFSYLNSVKVKTNVQSGGGSGSARAWRYFDVSQLDSNTKPMTFPFIVKMGYYINPNTINTDWTQVVAIGVDDSDNRIYTPYLGRTSWSRAMAGSGLTPEVMEQVGIIEITEDEFYYYDTIEFTTNGKTRPAEKGMTWEQWASSVFNDGWINIKDGKVTHINSANNPSPLKYYVEGEDKYYDVLATDVIIEGMNYTYIDE